MSISSEVRKAGPFAGNGATVVFPFTFKVFTAADLEVVSCVLATGVETVLTQDIDYTVNLNADQNSSPGGNVTLSAPLASGVSLIITSDEMQVQPTDLLNGGAFYADVINSSLDYLTILIQQLQEQVNRSLKVALIDPPFTTALPPAAQRANTSLYFDGTGAPALLPLSPTGTVLFAGSMLENPNGVRTVFTMTNSGAPFGRTPLQVTVWCNFPLVPGVGYTLGPSPGQVTYTDAPGIGDTVWAQGVY